MIKFYMKIIAVFVHLLSPLFCALLCLMECEYKSEKKFQIPKFQFAQQ